MWRHRPTMSTTKTPPNDFCRRCARGELHRVARRAWDRVFSLLGVYPFQCDVCRARSYRWRVERVHRVRVLGAPLAP
jgi:hypothetical protein